MNLNTIILYFCVCSTLCIADTFAHTVVVSEYWLKYKDNSWILSVQQKTSTLRDAIYDEKPKLKGMNLNSEIFLGETNRYISKNFQLKVGNKTFKLKPILMNYGGLSFEGMFSVPELSEWDKNLTIETSGFDDHEHSIKTLNIDMENQTYSFDFSKNYNRVIFSFGSKRFTNQNVDTNEKDNGIIWILGVLITIIIMLLSIKYWKA